MRLEHAMGQPVKVSAILAAIDPFCRVDQTLDSLCRQTLEDIEIIVVTSELPADAKAEVENRRLSDPRIRIIHAPSKNIWQSVNAALDAARGECVAFCAFGDVVPYSAYEKLYRSIRLKNADLSIGVAAEFSKVDACVDAQTVLQSDAASMPVYDENLSAAPYLFNKLFRRDLIEGLGLRFDDVPAGAHLVFFERYLSSCNSIVGAHAETYRRRKALSFEDDGAVVDPVDLRDVESFCDAFEEALRIRMNTLGCRAGGVGDGLSAADAEQIWAHKPMNAESLRYRFCRALLAYYCGNIWRLGADAADFLVERYEENRKKLATPARASLAAVEPSLFPAGDAALASVDELASYPAISVLVSENTEPATCAALVKSVYTQSFPSFELLVPEHLRPAIPEQFVSAKNISFVKCSRDEFLATALVQAKAPYVNMLEHAIFHFRDSLRAMWERMRDSQADFISFNMYCLPGEEVVKFRTMREVFRDKYSLHATMRHPIHKLDCSPNNKVFKRGALLGRPELVSTLSQSACQGVQLAHDKLSFEKDSTERMVSKLSDEWFLGQCSKDMVARFNVSNVDRYLHSDSIVELRALPGQKLAEMKARVRRASMPYRKQVLFTSNRSNQLPPNCRMVYDALGNDVRKVVMCHTFPHSQGYDTQLVAQVEKSKVIVTDDYLHVLNWVDIRPEQKVVQLWHASGAFKKFGRDYIASDLGYERMLHKDYAAALVSSEEVRPIYASAFGLPVDKILPLGTPRTDTFFDPEHYEAAIRRFYETYPGLAGKRIISYCPTFRQVGGRQVIWETGINWTSLSKSLPANTVLLVKKHPLETRGLVSGTYGNIREIDGVDGDTLCMVSELMITDYSSIIFDCCMVGTPVLYYCPDLDTYDTDFYAEFPAEYPGLFVRDAAELPEAIEAAIATAGDEMYANFKRKYMGACDGHATERTVALIRELLNS